MQDSRTPAQTSVISIVANILFGIILMRPLGHGGLALATTLASVVNLGLLIKALRIKLGQLGWRSIALSACRTMACSGIMGIVVWKLAVALIPSGAQSMPVLLTGLMVSIAAGFLTYGTVSYLIKSPEFVSIVTEVKNSFRKK
jgi:putative peptidoglycan lipid II flippase